MRYRLALMPVLFLVPVVICACGSADGAVPAEDVRLAIQHGIEAQGSAATLVDPRSGEPVQLVFDHVHEDVNPRQEVVTWRAWTFGIRTARFTTWITTWPKRGRSSEWRTS